MHTLLRIFGSQLILINILIAMLLGLVPLSVQASDDESSLVLPFPGHGKSGFLTFNTESSTLAGNHYFYGPDIYSGAYWFGVEGKIKLDNNLLSSLKGELPSGFGLKYSAGLQTLCDDFAKKGLELWLLGDYNFDYSTYNLFDAARMFDDQLYSVSFPEMGTKLSLNLKNKNLWDTGIFSVLGVSLGVKGINNINELDEVVIHEKTRSVSHLTSGEERTISQAPGDASVYEGDYRTSVGFPLSIDLYLRPTSSLDLGVTIYFRREFRYQFKNTSKIGLGVYWLRKPKDFPEGPADPLDPALGIALEYSGLFEQDANYNKGIDKQLSLQLTTSFQIPNVKFPNP